MIKLFWDFRGPDARDTAEHYCRHLKEFFALHGITDYEAGIEEMSNYFCSAWCVCSGEGAALTEKNLKPKRKIPL